MTVYIDGRKVEAKEVSILEEINEEENLLIKINEHGLENTAVSAHRFGKREATFNDIFADAAE